MYDGSKKQIENLQIGDNIKVVNVTNLNPQSNDYRNWSRQNIEGSISGSKSQK